MKIAAIFPGDQTEDSLGIDNCLDQPLGIAYVAQAAEDAGHDVKLYYKAPNLEEIADRDALAFSLLTRDVPAARRLSRLVKQEKPETRIIGGGSHVSSEYDIALEDWIDYGVIGEGDETFVELLECIEKNKSIESVKGLVYSDKGELVSTGQRPRLDPTGLRPMRHPDFFRVFGNDFYGPPASERRFIPIITSRGCTQGCEFCDSEIIWGRQVRYRTAEDVVAELEEIGPYKHDFIHIDDDNLFLKRNNAKEIIKGLIGKGYNMATQADIRLTDSDLLGLMKQAGWVTLLWGMESVNQDVLDKAKKGSTQEKIYHLMEESENLGIINHGLNMIGFDYETEESILEMGGKLKEYPVHQLRLTIVTPFVGTNFRKRLEQAGHSFDPDLTKWDTEHLVYDHPSIKPERMLELRQKIITDFYKSPQWDKRIHDMAKNNPHLKQSVDEFREYISSHLM